MTCIVALLDKDTLYMGGDSAGVAGLSITIRKDPKVFLNGHFLIGFTTSFRMGNLLRYKFKPLEQTAQQSDMEYMVTTFIDTARTCFKENGFGDKEGSEGGTFLVGYRSQLYTIGTDYQVAIPADAYDAVGSGADLALGAMYANQKSKLTPEQRVIQALEAAATFNAGVAAPFYVLKLPGEKKLKK